MKKLKALSWLLIKDLTRKSTVYPNTNPNSYIIILDEDVEGVVLVADEGLDEDVHHLPQQQRRYSYHYSR
jgi:ABC-type cobalamin transport system ATPase subunit